MIFFFITINLLYKLTFTQSLLELLYKCLKNNNYM